MDEYADYREHMLQHYIECGYEISDAEYLAHKDAEEMRESDQQEMLHTWL